MIPRISVVINTLNEEKNLPFALRSVRHWTDEIVVVDMHSDDRTVEIAREFGARVFFHERMGLADPARAFALEQASGDWILMLDADEIVPQPLSQTLMNIAGSGNADAVCIPWLNYLLGGPLMHTNWGPHQDTHIRFCRKGIMRPTAAVHDFLHIVPGSRIVSLRFEPGLAIVHFNCLDSQQFIEKLNRYTSIEAKQALERGEWITPIGALLKAAKEFGSRYFKGMGILDGWRGFYLSLFMSFYRIAAAAKVQELKALGPREWVESVYRREAEEILKTYGQAPPPTASAAALPPCE
jgi:glycosyltransferase involved in cell wall biosynthesis